MTVRAERPIVDFAHEDVDYAIDPSLFDSMRELSPVFWTERHGGYWVVTDYEQVCRVLRDPATFSSAHYQEPRDGIRYAGIEIPESPVIFGLAEDDPPRWNALRQATMPFLSPRTVASLEPHIAELAHSCIDRRVEMGHLDLVADIAAPIPALTVLELVGLPLDRWSFYADVLHRLSYLGHEDDGFADVMEGMGSIFEDLHSLVRDRRRRPKNDIVSSLIEVNCEGKRLTDDEIVSTAVTFVGGGVGTVTALLAHVFMHLQNRLDHRQQLMENPDLIPRAVEEFLRVFNPAQQVVRTVTCDVNLGDQRLHRGDRLLASIIAANHDAAERECPHQVQLDRFPNRHAAFGMGIHRCIGAPLARVESTVVLRAVLERIPDYTVSLASAQRYPRNPTTVNGWIAMPATFTRAKRPRSSRSLPKLD